MSQPTRPADAVVLDGPASAEFWDRHPEVEHAALEITEQPDQPWTRREEWSLWIREPANDVDLTLTKWLGPQRPDRPAELTFENAGHSPPPWFWQRHPDVAAFAIEHDPGDGINWWAYLWTGSR